MKVKEGTSTSSPSEIPRARIHRCRPLVPEFTAIASEAPTYSEMARSNSPTLGPKLRLDVRRTPVTAAMSCSVISGADSGILMSVANGREQQQREEYLNDVSSE